MNELVILALLAAAGTTVIEVIEPAPGFDDFALLDAHRWPLAAEPLTFADGFLCPDEIQAEFDSVFEGR